MATNVENADPTTRDAFGSFRVSEKTTVQDSQNVVDHDTRFFYNAVIYDSASPLILAESSNASGTGVNGSFIGPLDPDSRMVPLELDSTYADGQVADHMKEYSTYTPGKSHLFYSTGIFSPNTDKPNQQVRVVLRTSCSGSIDDIAINQSDWNKDKLDGSGGAANPSGITLNTNNNQLFWVDAQMLYAGTIRCGFSIDGKNITVHKKHIANLQNLPTLQNYNLPLRFEISNISSRAKARIGLFDKYNGLFLEVEDDFKAGKAKIWMKCHTVQSEGGADLGGLPSTEFKVATTTIGTTLTPIISIRLTPSFNGFPNNSLLFPIRFSGINEGNTECMLVLVHAANVTGGAWVDPVDVTGDNHHTYEINISATSMTGGHYITSVPLSKSGGSKTESVSQDIKHVRIPILFSRTDDLTVLQETLTLAAIVSTGTTSISAASIDLEEVRQ